jgi:hypothetical protein
MLCKLRARRRPSPTSDFLDLGNRAVVDRSLSRLTRTGKIQRIQRGLYDLPKMSTLLDQSLTPSPDELVRAWPSGLQPRLSEPVAVLLGEGRVTLKAANSAGYRYFTDIEAFKDYVETEILAAQEAGQGEAR